jgi:hypothetical protein
MASDSTNATDRAKDPRDNGLPKLSPSALKNLIGYNVALSFILGLFFYFEYTGAGHTWDNAHNQTATIQMQFKIDSAACASKMSNTDDALLKDSLSKQMDALRWTLDAKLSQPVLPKSKMLEFVLLCTLLAGGMGSVLSNFRGIYFALKTFNGFEKRSEIPYYIRPLMGMMSGMFAFLLSNFFTYNFNTPTAQPGWQSFDGLLPYIGVAFLAGFIAQEFVSRLKEIARAVFAYKANEVDLTANDTEKTQIPAPSTKDGEKLASEPKDENGKADLFIERYKEPLLKIPNVLLVEKKEDKNSEGRPLSIFIYVKDDETKSKINEMDLSLKPWGIKIPLVIQKIDTIKPQFTASNNNKISTIGGILKDKYGLLYGLGTCHGLKENLNNLNLLGLTKLWVNWNTSSWTIIAIWDWLT